jgi:hypothetical protein
LLRQLQSIFRDQEEIKRSPHQYQAGIDDVVDNGAANFDPQSLARFTIAAGQALGHS